ncbi:MAG: hypothetical protein PWQ79_1756 [Thermococcaceae archaeon]|nr:hypothetical protein [Thermococcaceae archaeon]MDK2914841.1 hypothetical protein [Thermococcaceae archaeon]
MGKKISSLFLFIVLLTSFPASAEYYSSITLTVYTDGYVEVQIDVVPDTYSPQLSIQLIGEHIEDLSVEDENGDPLNFRVEGNYLVLYPGDATLVKISYVTPDLTSKEGPLWTLNVSTNQPVTIVLPENSIVVDLSDIPLEITQNSITIPPGNQSISYIIEYSGSSDYSDLEGSEEKSSNQLPMMLFGLSALIPITIYGILRRKRAKKEENPTREELMLRLERLGLSDEEKKAILYIFDRGGRVSQAEVREALGLPKTTAWRIFKRLEEKGVVKILKGKKEHWVELNF